VQSTSDPDWWSSGWAEVGYLGSYGKTGTASFREYGDLSTGPLISNAGFLAENHKTAYYVSANVGNVARDDQYYQVNFGKYWRLQQHAVYDSIPHVFSTDSKILWNGAGTGQLTFAFRSDARRVDGGPGQAAFSAVAPGEVKLTREKGGRRGELHALRRVRVFLSCDQ